MPHRHPIPYPFLQLCSTTLPLLHIKIGELMSENSPQVDTAFNYNPRCIKRDFRPNGTVISMTYSKVTGILEQADLAHFQAGLEASVHPGGHVGIGGQQDDLYSGNGDPAFYFHHAQVDHVWNM